MNTRQKQVDDSTVRSPANSTRVNNKEQLREVDEIDEMMFGEMDLPYGPHKKTVERAFRHNMHKLPKVNFIITKNGFDSGEYYKDLDIQKKQMETAAEVIKVGCNVEALAGITKFVADPSAEIETTSHNAPHCALPTQPASVSNLQRKQTESD